MKRVKVAVVGAGVVGLSTAVCIAETLPYCSVTLISEKFSPHTTSDGAAGILLPKEFPDIPLEWQQQWFKKSFEYLLAIADSPQASDAGVYLSSGYQIFKDVPRDKKPFWADLVFGFRYMTDHELKRFPDHKFGQAFTTLKCECLSYLPWLEQRAPVDVEDVREEVWQQPLQQQQHVLQFLQHSHQQIVIQNVLLGRFQSPQTWLSGSTRQQNQFRSSLRHLVQ
nr:Zgc:172341 protein [Danio rerio]